MAPTTSMSQARGGDNGGGAQDAQDEPWSFVGPCVRDCARDFSLGASAASFRESPGVPGGDDCDSSSSDDDDNDANLGGIPKVKEKQKRYLEKMRDEPERYEKFLEKRRNYYKYVLKQRKQQREKERFEALPTN